MGRQVKNGKGKGSGGDGGERVGRETGCVPTRNRTLLHWIFGVHSSSWMLSSPE